MPRGEHKYRNYSKHLTSAVVHLENSCLTPREAQTVLSHTSSTQTPLSLPDSLMQLRLCQCSVVSSSPLAPTWLHVLAFSGASLRGRVFQSDTGNNEGHSEALKPAHCVSCWPAWETALVKDMGCWWNGLWFVSWAVGTPTVASCCHKLGNSTLTAFCLYTTRGSTVIHYIASVTHHPQRDRCLVFFFIFIPDCVPSYCLSFCLSFSLFQALPCLCAPLVCICLSCIVLISCHLRWISSLLSLVLLSQLEYWCSSQVGFWRTSYSVHCAAYSGQEPTTLDHFTVEVTVVKVDMFIAS